MWKQHVDEALRKGRIDLVQASFVKRVYEDRVRMWNLEVVKMGGLFVSTLAYQHLVRGPKIR